MTSLRKSGSLVAVWIKSLATAARCSFCSGSRSCGINFATTHFMPRSCVKFSDMVGFGIPRSASNSHTVSCLSFLIAACTCSTFSGVLLVGGLPERGSLSTDSWPSFKHLCHASICAALIASSLKAFWTTWIVSAEECSKLNAKFDADSLFYSLSHFECDGHTVHMLTQQCLLPPTDYYSEVIIIHTCTFQSTLLGFQVTSMSCKLFSLY